MRKTRTPTLAARRITGLNVGTRRTAATNTITTPAGGLTFTEWASKVPKPIALNLYDAGFPNCCGACVIYGFPQAYNSGQGARMSFDPEEVEASLKDLCIRNSGYAIILVILSKEQKSMCEPILERCGFKKSFEDFLHKGHGNELTLYCRVNNPKNKEEAPIEFKPEKVKTSTTEFRTWD